MTDVRQYGTSPYSTVILHGGPGAPGCAAGLCRALEPYCSVLEHLQKARTVDGLMEEILALLDRYNLEKPILTGHSYGAWLALLFAAKYPDRVGKIILIGCGPLKQEYLADIIRTRSERRKQGIDTDNYCILPDAGGDMLYFDEEQHISLMNEATVLRQSGILLERALGVKCPVVMFHGEYDPHPAAGSVGLLEGKLPEFRSYLLECCGHDPWKETYAREEFVRLLTKEVLS